MATHAIATTADDLLKLPTGEGKRYELIAGELQVMSPGNFEHGCVAMTAGCLLGNHVRANKLGRTQGAETGFILATDPDTVRAPDASFVSQARVDAIGRTERYWPGGAPDLAIEVISPEDSRPYVRAKALEWLNAGATAVLVLDPRKRAATVYRAGEDVQIATDGEIDLSDAVPGWVVAVADFFV